MIDLALDGRVMIYNEFDEALQELDLLFNTENTELLGDYKYGTAFEQFSWQLNPNEDSIKQYVESKLMDTLYLSKYKRNIEVTSDKGEYRLIYYIKIYIYPNDNSEPVIRKYEYR